MRLWSQVGPARDLSIERLDVVNGRERFRVTASLAKGDLVNWPPREARYFSVASEGGLLRIAEFATALAAP